MAGHHAHVDVDGLVAAKLGELRILEDVQELGLPSGFHFGNFVQEDGPGIGLFKFPDARGRRPTGETRRPDRR